MSGDTPVPDATDETDAAFAAEIETILASFTRYHPDRIELSLDRMYRLLSDLGDPHLALPPVIHIAGTNGKGSTAAFLAAALEIAGKRVSVYTSPHLLRLNERYHVAGAPLDNVALLQLFEEIDATNAGKSITEFEITTAAALLAMARAPADIVILETGLGGRCDATNVIAKPAATVITRIGLDHMDFLGPDIAAIAAEKAAIQKRDVPSIVAPQDPVAAAVIADAARSIGAPLYRAGTEWQLEPTADGGGVFRHGDTVWPLPPPGLPGRHQLDNAATAAACLKVCDLTGMTRDAIAIGIRNVTWPGRMEWVQRGALADLLPQGWELWFDAAHNPLGAQALAESFKTLNTRDDRPFHLVFALLDDKDNDGFLAPFVGLADTVTAVPIPDEDRAQSVPALLESAASAGFIVRAAENIHDALSAFTREPGSARVLVTGSHPLIGAAMTANRTTGLQWLDQVDGGHYCAH